MATKTDPTPEDDASLDDLSVLQNRLEDLGVMFYTYLGIIQRDAPPVSRLPDEADEAANDALVRNDLHQKAITFANDVVKCSQHVDALITRVEKKIHAIDGKERQLLDAANFESMQAGEEMIEALDDANKLLNRVRHVMVAREAET